MVDNRTPSEIVRDYFQESPPPPHRNYPPRSLPPPVSSSLLDSPESPPQRRQPPTGSDPPDQLPDCRPDLTLAQSLQIAAVNAQLADTDAPIREPDRLSTTFRHSGWRHNRLLVYRSLLRTKQPVSRRSNFANCGSDAYVLQSVENPSVYRIAGSACHDRFCLPCGQERSQAVTLNVLELTAGRRIRFLTLTLVASSHSLDNQLDHLYASFQALRRRRLWKSAVTGGVAFLEVTWSQEHLAWHPHLHILIEGAYLPHAQLKKLWHEITGDSFIVHIRAVPDLRTAARYVTKYAAKPFNNTFLNRDACLDEAIVAFKGRKLIITFGSWRSVTLIRKPEEGAWDHVAPLEIIITEAANGDVDAQAIMRALTDADLADLYRCAPPRPPPRPKPEPVVSQLTFFGVWNDRGFYVGPDKLSTTMT